MPGEQRPIAADADTANIDSPLGNTADMAGPNAGLLSVENDSQRSSVALPCRARRDALLDACRDHLGGVTTEQRDAFADEPARDRRRGSLRP